MRVRTPGSQNEKLDALVSLLVILIVVATLYFVKQVFVPLALALLFSFLLAPVVTRFEKWRVPRVPAVLLAVTLALALVGAAASLVVKQVVDLTLQLPAYKDHIQRRIDTIKGHPGDRSALKDATATVQELEEHIAGTTNAPNATRPDGPTSAGKAAIQQVEVVQPATSLAALAQSVAGPVLAPFGTAAVVVLFVLFMLLKREDLRDRIIHLVGRGQLNLTTQALDEAAGKVTSYLAMQVIINIAFGVSIGLGLWVIGIPNAFLWGFLGTLLRFIPYVGAWVALAFPLLLSLATTDAWTAPAETLALFFVVEMIASNVLEPWLYGSHTGLSPVAIMVATIFWTWLWGGVGLLLATPLTVCVAVIGKYIPSLSFLDALLGDEPTLSVHQRFYQRLLAMDRREAGLVAAEFRKEHSLPETYSTLFVPTLAEAEREEGRGALDERHKRFIFDTTRELVEELHAEDVPAPASAAALDHAALELSKFPVFCLPAVDEADDIAALMLAQLLEREGYKAESFSHKTLANEMLAQVTESGSQVVCISATPPHDTLHTRYLCKLLRARLPKLYIVVGLWDAEVDETKLARRRERLAADKVVTTLADALEQIRPFATLEAVDVARD